MRIFLARRGARNPAAARTWGTAEGLRGERQADGEAAPRAGGAVEGDRGAGGQGDGGGGGGPAPGAAGLAGPRDVEPHERLEHALGVLGGDADAAVLHGEQRVAVRGAERQLDLPAGRRVLDGVLDEVAQGA